MKCMLRTSEWKDTEYACRMRVSLYSLGEEHAGCLVLVLFNPPFSNYLFIQSLSLSLSLSVCVCYLCVLFIPRSPQEAPTHRQDTGTHTHTRAHTHAHVHTQVDVGRLNKHTTLLTPVECVGFGLPRSLGNRCHACWVWENVNSSSNQRRGICTQLNKVYLSPPHLSLSSSPFHFLCLPFKISLCLDHQLHANY